MFRFAPTLSSAFVSAALIAGCTRMVAAPEGERLVELHPAPADARSLPHEFDVVVWNIHKGQKNAWARELERLDRAAELLVLQEGYRSEIFDEMVEGTNDQWWMGVSFHYVRKREHTKVATGVVTVAPVESKTAVVRHSPTREPLFSTPKAALLSEYALEGSDHTLLVINVHAINFRPAEHLSRQLAQLRAPIEAHVGPVILAGDFNTHHRPRLEALEELAGSLGLTAVFPNWRDDPRGNRRPVKDGRTRHLRWPLDHVYVRGLEVSEAKIHADSQGSDHKPLSFHVRW